ncbi:hypothetical protein RRG08_017105 [Elysia crispata]|uniref:Uncharacterized protein n=1 Tax=Elysia crispata TaxID=231223 RepID=A0AAE0ZN75_9GAST|nr:hypothetical protein RRG08_017105 [Elysia crispata]
MLLLPYLKYLICISARSTHVSLVVLSVYLTSGCKVHVGPLGCYFLDLLRAESTKLGKGLSCDPGLGCVPLTLVPTSIQSSLLKVRHWRSSSPDSIRYSPQLGSSIPCPCISPKNLLKDETNRFDTNENARLSLAQLQGFPGLSPRARGFNSRHTQVALGCGTNTLSCLLPRGARSIQFVAAK